MTFALRDAGCDQSAIVWCLVLSGKGHRTIHVWYCLVLSCQLSGIVWLYGQIVMAETHTICRMGFSEGFFGF